MAKKFAPTPWTINDPNGEFWKGRKKKGYRPISIIDANGEGILYVGNEAESSALRLALKITKAINSST